MASGATEAATVVTETAAGSTIGVAGGPRPVVSSGSGPARRTSRSARSPTGTAGCQSARSGRWPAPVARRDRTREAPSAAAADSGAGAA